MTSKLAPQWLPCQAPGIVGSVLGLVSPVSVYCDWVRWRVGSATSILVWQHVNCQSRSVPKIHSHAAETTNKPLSRCVCYRRAPWAAPDRRMRKSSP